MKHEDVAARQAKERDDWQKRGIGGLVSAVDSASGTITISVAAAGGTKAVSHSHGQRHGSPPLCTRTPCNFDEAKAAAFGRRSSRAISFVRGARAAPMGASLPRKKSSPARSGIFPATVNSVDAAMGVVSVTDLVTKKPVVVKITAQSQVRKLPAAMAQGIAARLKGSPAGAAGAAAGGAAAPAEASRQRGGPGAGGPRAGGGGGPADLQQAINRAPAATLSDLQKGDAVMIVSTVNSGSTDVTAITLVAGVEPILQASPNGSQGMVLSPWNLGAPGGEGEGAQ